MSKYTVTLDDDTEAFVQKLVDTGRCNTKGEAIDQAMQLLKKQFNDNSGVVDRVITPGRQTVSAEEQTEEKTAPSQELSASKKNYLNKSIQRILTYTGISRNDLREFLANNADEEPQGHPRKGRCRSRSYSRDM